MLLCFIQQFLGTVQLNAEHSHRTGDTVALNFLFDSGESNHTKPILQKVFRLKVLAGYNMSMSEGKLFTAPLQAASLCHICLKINQIHRYSLHYWEDLSRVHNFEPCFRLRQLYMPHLTIDRLWKREFCAFYLVVRGQSTSTGNISISRSRALKISLWDICSRSVSTSIVEVVPLHVQ